MNSMNVGNIIAIIAIIVAIILAVCPIIWKFKKNRIPHLTLLSQEATDKDGNINKLSNSDLSVEEINDLMSQKNSIGIYMFRGKKSMILNLLDYNENIVFKDSYAKVKVLNKGCAIKKIKVTGGTIFFNSSEKPYILKGNTKFTNFLIERNDTNEIFISDVSNVDKVKISSDLYIREAIKNNIEEKPNVFELSLPNHTFAYSRILINIQVCTEYNEIFKCELIINVQNSENYSELASSFTKFYKVK